MNRRPYQQAKQLDGIATAPSDSDRAALDRLAAVNPIYRPWRSRNPDGSPGGWYASIRRGGTLLQPTLGADTARHLERLLKSPPMAIDPLGRLPFGE